MADGNIAAMREALELLNQLFDSGVLGTHSEMTADEMDQVDELYFKTKAALSAPPRNCDRYATFLEARKAFFSTYVPDETEDSASAFAAWLMAPAEGGAE